MPGRTELIFHAAAALAVVAVWLGVGGSGPEWSRSPDQNAPGTSGVLTEAGVALSGKEPSFRERAAAVFSARMESAARIQDPRRREEAYLRLADEAFRSSPEAAKMVLAALVKDPESKLADWKGQSLMLLFGLRVTDTPPEFKRLDALCAADALEDLIAGPGRDWPGAPDNFSSKRQCALVEMASGDPEGFGQLLVKHPDFLQDIGYYNPDEDSRILNPFLNAVMDIARENPQALEKMTAFSKPENMSPEMQIKVAASLAPVASGSPGLLSIFSRFYAEANPETRHCLEENSPPEAKKLIAEEQMLERGEVPTDSAQTPLGIVSRQYRDQPLTEAQTGALLAAAAEKGELKPGTDDLGYILSRSADPAALLAAVPQSPKTKDLSEAIYKYWSSHDAVGLSAALSQGKLADPDQGIEALVKSQRGDPEAQLLWAQRISDPAARQRVLEPLLKRNAKALPELVGRISREQGYSAAPSTP